MYVRPHEGISACSDAERCEEAVAAGMDGFLIKPFRLIDLIKVIKEHAANEKLQNSRKHLVDGILLIWWKSQMKNYQNLQSYWIW